MHNWSDIPFSLTEVSVSTTEVSVSTTDMSVSTTEVSVNTTDMSVKEIVMSGALTAELHGPKASADRVNIRCFKFIAVFYLFTLQ